MAAAQAPVWAWIGCSRAGFRHNASALPGSAQPFLTHSRQRAERGPAGSSPLARGKIVDGCKVQCPFNRARFDIRTGEVIDWANFPPGVQLMNVLRSEKALKSYPVSIKGTSVMVKLT